MSSSRPLVAFVILLLVINGLSGFGLPSQVFGRDRETSRLEQPKRHELSLAVRAELLFDSVDSPDNQPVFDRQVEQGFRINKIAVWMRRPPQPCIAYPAKRFLRVKTWARAPPTGAALASPCRGAGHFAIA